MNEQEGYSSTASSDEARDCPGGHDPTSLRRALMTTVTMTLLVFPFCYRWGISPNLDLVPYVVSMGILIFLAVVPTMIVFCLVCILLRRRDLLFERNIPIRWFAANLLILLLVCWWYSHIKTGVLLAETYDDVLYRWDCVIFGGAEPWQLCRHILDESCAGTLCLVYCAFFPVLIACILWLTLCGRQDRSDALTCAIVIGYAVGLLGYHLAPVYGPAFVFTSASPGELSPLTNEMQDLLWKRTTEVQQDPSRATILPWKYIAAFPSLHISHVLLAAWYARHSRIAVVLLSLFSVLTAISTVYLGWHYVVDWLGGVVVAAIAVWLTSRRPITWRPWRRSPRGRK